MRGYEINKDDYPMRWSPRRPGRSNVSFGP
jgi:hypothetical protein